MPAEIRRTDDRAPADRLDRHHGNQRMSQFDAETLALEMLRPGAGRWTAAIAMLAGRYREVEATPDRVKQVRPTYQWIGRDRTELICIQISSGHHRCHGQIFGSAPSTRASSLNRRTPPSLATYRPANKYTRRQHPAIRHVRSCPPAEQAPDRPDLYAAIRRDHKWRGRA
jgi:hypothetical protein